MLNMPSEETDVRCDKLVDRIHRIEIRWAIVTTAAVAFGMICLIFTGVEYFRIPRMVQRAVDAEIGTETRKKLEEAAKYADQLLGASLVYGFVPSNHEDQYSGTTNRWTCIRKKKGHTRVRLTQPMPDAIVIATPANEANRQLFVNTTSSGEQFDVFTHTLSKTNGVYEHEAADCSFSFAVFPANGARVAR
jgi:hypothetical protein